VQGHTAFAVELRAGHFSATQSTGASDTDALGTCTLCGLHGLLHRTAERHAGSQLLSNALGNKLCFHLGVLDLEDVQLDLLARQLLKLAADAVCFSAAAADNDARTCRVDIHTDTVAGALDFDLGDTGALHARGHELADTDVFANEVLVPLAGFGAVSKPVRYVIGGDAESEPVRVNFLSHLASLLFLRGSDYHGDVARALLDLKCTTLGSRLEPLHGRAFINKRFADDEVTFVKRNAVAVREDPGVGDCRLNYLEYRL